MLNPSNRADGRALRQAAAARSFSRRGGGLITCLKHVKKMTVSAHRKQRWRATKDPVELLFTCRRRFDPYLFRKVNSARHRPRAVTPRTVPDEHSKNSNAKKTPMTAAERQRKSRANRQKPKPAGTTKNEPKRKWISLAEKQRAYRERKKKKTLGGEKEDDAGADRGNNLLDGDDNSRQSALVTAKRNPKVTTNKRTQKGQQKAKGKPKKKPPKPKKGPDKKKE